MPKLRSTLLLVFVVSLAAAGCPKNGKVDGGSGASPRAKISPSPSATPIAFAADARRILTLGLGADRLQWDDPPIAPGESVTWNVISDPPGAPRSLVVTRPAGTTDRWILRAREETVELTLNSNGSAATSLRWTATGAAPVVIDAPEALRSLYTAPHRLSEPEFSASGGTLMGNEVVRVPAGNFRARHGLVRAGAFTRHFYVAHSVPGGVVKMEEFANGADHPALILELEEFTRLKPETAPAP